MKHIVIDARESGTSTGRYIDKLVEYLHLLLRLPDAPDYQITLLAKPHRLEFFAYIAPEFTAVACPHKEFTFSEQLGLKRQIKGLHPNLVHFPAAQQPVLYRGRVVTTMQDLTTIRFRNPAKNPIVFTVKQQVYKWLNKQVARKSVALITPTEFVKRDITDYTGVDPGKITVTLESADDLPRPAITLEGLEGAKYIMYVGRPTPHKNLERLVDAFVQIKPQHPDLQLVFVGKRDANYERLETQAAQKGTDGIVFTGFISDEQLRWLYQHCQAYVFPSLSEGFGLPGLEAMRHGAPVVSSNATCLPEVYGDAALYFDPLNIQDMADKLNQMLSDETLRKRYIEKGYEQAGKYSWQRMAEQTLEVYRKTLET